MAFAATWLFVVLLFFSLIASKRPSYMVPCSVPVAILGGHLWARAFERRRSGAVAAGGSLTVGLTGIAILCAAAGVVAILAGPAGLAMGISQGRYDGLLSRRLLFGGTAAGLLAAAVLLIATRRLARPAAAFAAAVLPIAVIVPLAHAASGYLDEARSSRPVSRFLAMRLKPDDMVVCYEQFRPGLNFYLRRPIYLMTTGTPFSSWYIKAHLDEKSRDPKFPIIPDDRMRRLLEAPVPGVYVLAPRRMYDRLREETGDTLRPDPIYEDLGAGLFVRAAGGRDRMARAAGAPSGVLSSPSPPRAGAKAPGRD